MTTRSVTEMRAQIGQQNADLLQLLSLNVPALVIIE